MDQDDTERAIEARASEDGAFAVAYALLKIAKALNVRPLTVDELDEPIDSEFQAAAEHFGKSQKSQ